MPAWFSQWGPFAVVAATAVIVGAAVGVAYLTGDHTPTVDVVVTTSVPSETTTVPASPFAYPMSFPQAQEQGIVDTIEWGDRCDIDTGRLAVADVLAPVCMAPFVGDNGGATSTGVGSKTIKIVFYLGPENDPITRYINDTVRIDDTNAQKTTVLTEFMPYFEQFYELYGRSVELVTYQSTAAPNDEAKARSDAQRIAEQIRPFAVIGGPAFTFGFADELAARKVVCIDCGLGSAQWYKDRAPYVWSTDASLWQKQIHTIELIQKQLVGKKATHAGKGTKDKPRVFGLVYNDFGPEAKVLADQMAAALEAMGSRAVEILPYKLDPATMQATATDLITKLKAAGVTTVILSTDQIAPRELTRQATAQDYNPEWLVGASTQVDTNTYGRFYDRDQWQHAFGVTTSAARVDPSTHGYYALYQWFTGTSPFADQTIENFMPSFAYLFSAIQSAGPNLTPESLATAFGGLSTAQGISHPYYRWGDNKVWQDPDYSGVEDATFFFWDSKAMGQDEMRRDGTGMMQFPTNGKRYMPGEWTSEDILFQTKGAIIVFVTPPLGEEVPSYPSPAAVETSTTIPSTEPDESTTTSAAGSSTTSSPAGSSSTSLAASSTTTTTRPPG